MNEWMNEWICALTDSQRRWFKVLSKTKKSKRIKQWTVKKMQLGPLASSRPWPMTRLACSLEGTEAFPKFLESWPTYFIMLNPWITLDWITPLITLWNRLRPGRPSHRKNEAEIFIIAILGEIIFFYFRGKKILVHFRWERKIEYGWRF